MARLPIDRMTMLQQGMEAIQASIQEITAAMMTEKDPVCRINMAGSKRAAEKTRDRIQRDIEKKI